MRAIEDLSGKIFGRLKVLRYSGEWKWECLCECGNTLICRSGNLKSGSTSSCGCLRTEMLHARGLRHGHSANGSVSPEYAAYMGARARCSNPNSASYSRYGGRGIEFRFESFEEWIAELGPKTSPIHSVDRINNEGHYEKGNIHWATRQEQMANRSPITECRRGHPLIAGHPNCYINPNNPTYRVCRACFAICPSTLKLKASRKKSREKTL